MKSLKKEVSGLREEIRDLKSIVETASLIIKKYEHLIKEEKEDLMNEEGLMEFLSWNKSKLNYMITRKLIPYLETKPRGFKDRYVFSKAEIQQWALMRAAMSQGDAAALIMDKRVSK